MEVSSLTMCLKVALRLHICDTEGRPSSIHSWLRKRRNEWGIALEVLSPFPLLLPVTVIYM